MDKPSAAFSTAPPPPRGENEPLVIIPGDIDQQRGYRITKWRTYPNYECIYCQFSTIYSSKMEKHQAVGEHPWAYPGQNPVPEGEVIDEEGPTY